MTKIWKPKAYVTPMRKRWSLTVATRLQLPPSQSQTLICLTWNQAKTDNHLASEDDEGKYDEAGSMDIPMNSSTTVTANGEPANNDDTGMSSDDKNRHISDKASSTRDENLT